MTINFSADEKKTVWNSTAIALDMTGFVTSLHANFDRKVGKVVSLSKIHFFATIRYKRKTPRGVKSFISKEKSSQTIIYKKTMKTWIFVPLIHS